MDCIFCKIANKEAPSKSIYETESVLGFQNIKPGAPIHLLFIPKKHIEWDHDFIDGEEELLGQLISAGQKVARDMNIFEACKLIFNIGKTGNIPHIHLHLLGGWEEGNLPMDNT